MSIAENVAEVRERIATAAHRAGRCPEEITLMAVSKTFPAASIRQAYDMGIRAFGENRVQEFSQKVAEIRDLKDAAFHMIGHLQSNKAAAAVELFDAVDSLDSLKLAQKLNSSAQSMDKKLPVLIEINVGGEAAKTGLPPESDAIREILTATPQLEYLDFRGLMTVPPFSENPERARPYFRKLRELGDQIASRHLSAIRMDVLSMGMSHDFEIAIEEGSTCVRVGTAIFGQRTNKA
jgi:pyridoxal phosphate enzyme (YggS family)